MYIPNSHFTRIVTWTLSGSIITSSCTNTSPLPEFESLNVDDNKEEDNCVIKINLCQEDATFLDEISKLADELVQNPKAAQQLLRNTSNIIRTRSTAISNLVLDEELEYVTKALADDDISEAIRNQDIKSYLLLMNERGLLKKNTEEHYDILTSEQRKEILRSLGVPEAEIQDFPFMIGAVVSILYIAVAVISYGAVAYTAIAAVNMAALATVAFKVAAITSTKVSGYTSLDFSKDPNFDIWILKCNDETIQMPIKEYEEAIREIIEAYRQIGGEKMKYVTDEQLKSIMNTNLSYDLQRLNNKNS